jgi:hypothetical protein
MSHDTKPLQVKHHHQINPTGRFVIETIKVRTPFRLSDLVFAAEILVHIDILEGTYISSPESCSHYSLPSSISYNTLFFYPTLTSYHTPHPTLHLIHQLVLDSMGAPTSAIPLAADAIFQLRPR